MRESARFLRPVMPPRSAFRYRRGALALMLLTGVAGCLDLKVIPDTCSVTVAPASLSLPVNGQSPLIGTAFDCNGNSIRNKKVAFSSSNPAVATVTSEGVVVAIAVGGASVSATSNGKSASMQVTVTPEAASSVTLSPTTLILRKTTTSKLTAVARNAQNQTISGRTFRWSSNNAAVAVVDQSGTVTAVAPGNAIITAETDQIAGNAQVSVTEIPIGSCSLAPTASRLTVGQSVQPTLTLRDTANNVLPSLGRTIFWSSNNETVAGVSQTGLIVVRKAGSAIITATPVENTAVTCRATVDGVDPRVAAIVITPRTGTLRLGAPRGLTATLLDSTNTQIGGGRVINWSTSTPGLVQVTQAGIITGIALGNARIIASAEGVADTVTYAVTPVPVASVALSPLQASVIEGQTLQLRATVTDSAGTVVTDRPIEWLSGDLSKATVSSTGLVTARVAGNVQIGATTEGKSGTTALTIVAIPVDTIEVSGPVTVNVAQTTAFAITLRDAQGTVLTYRNVLVTSSQPGIALGQQNPQSTLVSVTGIAVGTATLTVQAIDANNRAQGKASSVQVTVRAVPPPAPVPE